MNIKKIIPLIIVLLALVFASAVLFGLKVVWASDILVYVIIALTLVIAILIIKAALKYSKTPEKTH